MYEPYNVSNPYYNYNQAPYVNPMLQQYQNPYQQKAIAQNLNGKVVDSLEVVKAMDIPMDGQSYYFPKADGTEIYCKRWNANGTTSITAYKPILDSLCDSGDNLSNTGIKEQIQALQSATDSITRLIDDRFDKLEKNFSNAKKNSAKLKESDIE